MEFTWEEVAEHNTADSAWVISNGKVYDITDWLPRHPGGSEILLLAAGRDVTDLLPSYHPFALEHAEKALASYEIGKLVGRPEFVTYKPDSGFYKTLRERVGQYFAEAGLDPKDPTGMVVRMVPVFFGFWATFWLMHQADSFPLWARLGFAVLFGLFQAFPLLHSMHDATHVALGHSETWWKWWGRVPMELMAGSSVVAWHSQHVVGHHVYTNVYLADPDMPAEGETMRVFVPRQFWVWTAKFQHIYMPILYSLLAIKMRVDDVLEVWLKGRDGPIRVNWHESPLIRVLGVKILWLTWRFLLPALFFPHTPLSTLLLLNLATELTTGWWLAFNFQVSHISDNALFPLAEDLPESRQVPVEWAVAQAASSVNYDAGGVFGDFLAGNLNHQIEHHLFPCISQYHYAAIAPIVKQTCEEFDIPYVSYPSYSAALQAHLKFLYDMGQQGKPVSMMD